MPLSNLIGAEQSYGFLREFIAGFGGGEGYARPTRYEIDITLGKGAGGAGGDSWYKNLFTQVKNELTGQTVHGVALRCENIAMPGRALSTATDTNIYGPTRNIVQGISYANISATFQCSYDLREKKLFETWQRQAYNPESWAIGYYDDYVGSIDIWQLDENDQRRYGVKLIECYPISLNEQSYNYGQTNEIQKITVGFSYRYWRNLTDENDLPRHIVDNLSLLALNQAERAIQRNLPKVLRRL